MDVIIFVDTQLIYLFWTFYVIIETEKRWNILENKFWLTVKYFLGIACIIIYVKNTIGSSLNLNKYIYII